MWDTYLGVMFWHRHAVGKQGPPTTLDLKASAFDPKEKYWTKFPSEGSKHTPPHNSIEFKWKDYCPLVFRLVSCFTWKVLIYKILIEHFSSELWGSSSRWMQLITCYLYVGMTRFVSSARLGRVEASFTWAMTIDTWSRRSKRRK